CCRQRRPSATPQPRLRASPRTTPGPAACRWAAASPPRPRRDWPAGRQGRRRASLGRREDVAVTLPARPRRLDLVLPPLAVEVGFRIGDEALDPRAMPRDPGLYVRDEPIRDSVQLVRAPLRQRPLLPDFLRVDRP